MGQNVVKYACCQCCQHPGCCTACCCSKRLKHTKCGDCVLSVANAFPCLLCCRVPVTKTVLMLGLKGAGKTTLLYYFMLNKQFAGALPTKGFNNEVVSFSSWQSYEFWDPGGSAVQRDLWARYYQRMYVDYVIYVIDGFKYARADPKRRERILDDDRMELHALLEEEELRGAKFVVMINFTTHLSPDNTKSAIADITDIMELRKYPQVRVVSDPDSCKAAIDVEKEPTKKKLCCCCC